jgi:Zn-dependent protease with chaperone function
VKYVPKEVPEGINAPRTNALAELGLLAGALLGLLVGGFYALGLASDWLAVRLSPRLEAAIGERFPMASAGVEVVAGRERAILDALLAHVPNQPHDVRLRVLCDERGVNAFAIPGGRIVVLGGLLDAVQSENELAFVLAHELGHMQNRDHLRALGRGLVLMTLLTAVGTGGDFASELVVGSGVAVGHRFSQGQELAADRFAAELVQETYGHVGGLTDFFGRPALRDGGSWFGTHPASARRVHGLEDLKREKGWQAAPVAPYASPPRLCAR